MLPIPGSALSAKFSGPYDIVERLSDTDYVIRTPERRRTTRVCLINMLKQYYSRSHPDDKQKLPEVIPPFPQQHCCALVVTEPDDDLAVHSSARPSARLSNSDMLKEFPNVLSHLSPEQKADILALINRFFCLFQDVLSRTTVAQHDIDVGNAKPIKKKKKHAYCVNPAKRELMRKEAEYLLQHGLPVHSTSP